jgi:hypothetical protein
MTAKEITMSPSELSDIFSELAGVVERIGPRDPENGEDVAYAIGFAIDRLAFDAGDECRAMRWCLGALQRFVDVGDGFDGGDRAAAPNVVPIRRVAATGSTPHAERKVVNER